MDNSEISDLKKQLLQALLRSHIPGESDLAARMGALLVRNKLREVGGDEAVNEVYAKFQSERARLLAEREGGITFRVRVEGEWSAHEWKRLFSAFDDLYLLFALEAAPDGKRQKPLMVNSIQYGSPGALIFAGYAVVLERISRFVRTLSTFVTACFKNRFGLAVGTYA